MMKVRIIDFRRKATTLVPLILKDDMVVTVEHFTFLGLTICNTPRWDEDTKLITKQAQQRMYFLRPPKKCGVNRGILTQVLQGSHRECTDCSHHSLVTGAPLGQRRRALIE